MEARHLRYAIALAEHQHFGRAAASLGIAQPPLSKQIRDLEAEVGTALFARTPRGVFPTDAGAAFLVHAEVALGAMAAASTAAIRAARGELGALRVGFISSALLELLPALLPTFTGSRPEVQLELHERSSRAAAEGLVSGDLDVVFTRGGPRGRGAERTTSVSLGRERIVAVVGPTHPFVGTDQITINQLEGQPLILAAQYEEPTMISAILGTIGDILGHPLRPERVTQAGDLHTIIGLAACGLGVGLAASSIRAAIRPRMWVCDVEPAVYLPDLVMSYRTDDPSEVLRSFVDAAADRWPAAVTVPRRPRR